MLVAYNFPERQYKEIFSVVSEILKNNGVKLGIRQWPHISIILLPDISEQQQLDIKQKLSEKPQFQIQGWEIFSGGTTPFDYLVLSLDNPPEMKRAYETLKDEYNVISRFPFKPHSSIVAFSKEYRETVETLLPEIKAQTMEFLYDPVKPNQIQFWDKVGDSYEVVAVTEKQEVTEEEEAGQGDFFEWKKAQVSGKNSDGIGKDGGVSCRNMLISQSWKASQTENTTKPHMMTCSKTENQSSQRSDKKPLIEDMRSFVKSLVPSKRDCSRAEKCADRGRKSDFLSWKVADESDEQLGLLRHRHIPEKRFYHVVDGRWDGRDLLPLGDEDEFARRWPDAGDLKTYHAHVVHMFDNIEDVEDFPIDGEVLEIDPDAVDWYVDDLEFPHPVAKRVPAEAISRLKSESTSDFSCWQRSQVSAINSDEMDEGDLPHTKEELEWHLKLTEKQKTEKSSISSEEKERCYSSKIMGKKSIKESLAFLKEIYILNPKRLLHHLHEQLTEHPSYQTLSSYLKNPTLDKIETLYSSSFKNGDIFYVRVRVDNSSVRLIFRGVSYFGILYASSMYIFDYDKDISYSNLKKKIENDDIFFESHSHQIGESLTIKKINWVEPSESQLKDEFNEADIDSLLLGSGYPKPGQKEEAFEFFKNNLHQQDINPSTLSKDNSFRFDFDDYASFKKQVTSYGGPKDPDSMIRKIQAGGGLPMPVVIHKRDDSYVLAGGATRVSIAKLAGQDVKALVIEEDVAKKWRAEKVMRSIEAYIKDNPESQELWDKLQEYVASKGRTKHLWKNFDKETYGFHAMMLGIKYENYLDLMGFPTQLGLENLDDNLGESKGNFFMFQKTQVFGKSSDEMNEEVGVCPDYSVLRRCSETERERRWNHCLERLNLIERCSSNSPMKLPLTESLKSYVKSLVWNHQNWRRHVNDYFQEESETRKLFLGFPDSIDLGKIEPVKHNPYNSKIGCYRVRLDNSEYRIILKGYIYGDFLFIDGYGFFSYSKDSSYSKYIDADEFIESTDEPQHFVNPSLSEIKEVWDFQSIRAVLVRDNLIVWNPNITHDRMIPFLVDKYPDIGWDKKLNLRVDYRDKPPLVVFQDSKVSSDDVNGYVDMMKTHSRFRKITPFGFDLLVSDNHNFSKQIQVEMAQPNKKISKSVWYHGTPREGAANNIWNQGLEPDMSSWISPMAVSKPVTGRVYLTKDLRYAIIYLLGGDLLGYEIPEGKLKTDGEKGYLFVVDGSELSDVHPDEDQVGQAFHDHLKFPIKNKWMSRFVDALRDEPPLDGDEDNYGNLVDAIEDGDYISMIKAGKIILPDMTEKEELDIISKYGNVAHQGKVMPKEGWEFMKKDSIKLKEDGSNFFELAKRVFVRADESKLVEVAIGESFPSEVYHETITKFAPAIKSSGLQPRVGSIVGQAYLDDESGIHPVPAVFMSDEKSELGYYCLWQMENELGISKEEATVEQLKQHGAVCIIKPSSSFNKIYRKDSDNDVIYDSDGDFIEYLDTANEEDVPVDRLHLHHVEHGDYFSLEGVAVSKILTGEQLIDFLRKNSQNHAIVAMFERETKTSRVKKSSIKEAHVENGSLKWTEDFDEDDLIDAVEHLNLIRRRNFDDSLKLDALSSADSGFEDPKTLLSPSALRGKEKGWLRGTPKEQWQTKLREEHPERSDGFSNVISSPELNSVIVINGDLGDGFGRCLLAYALGEPVHAYHFTEGDDEFHEDNFPTALQTIELPYSKGSGPVGIMVARRVREIANQTFSRMMHPDKEVPVAGMVKHIVNDSKGRIDVTSVLPPSQTKRWHKGEFTEFDYHVLVTPQDMPSLIADVEGLVQGLRYQPMPKKDRDDDENDDNITESRNCCDFFNWKKSQVSAINSDEIDEEESEKWDMNSTQKKRQKSSLPHSMERVESDSFDNSEKTNTTESLSYLNGIYILNPKRLLHHLHNSLSEHSSYGVYRNYLSDPSLDSVKPIYSPTIKEGKTFYVRVRLDNSSIRLVLRGNVSGGYLPVSGMYIFDYEKDKSYKDLKQKIDGNSILFLEAEYQGKEVSLNKPTRGDVKKYKVFVKDPDTGNIKKVNFGDPNMKIKRDNPERRRSFRARHKCDTAKDKTTPRYWSCRFWDKKPVSKMVEKNSSEEVELKSDFSTYEDVVYSGDEDTLPDEIFDTEQLSLGFEAELQRVKDKDEAMMIAKDNLIQDPDYYSKRMDESMSIFDEEVILALSKDGNVLYHQVDPSDSLDDPDLSYYSYIVRYLFDNVFTYEIKELARYDSQSDRWIEVEEQPPLDAFDRWFRQNSRNLQKKWEAEKNEVY